MAAWRQVAGRGGQTTRMERRWRRAGRRWRLDAEEERRFSPGRDAARGSARPGGITRMRQGARAVRPARRAGPGRSTTTRGGARGGGTAGDGGGGERRSEFCEVWERRDLWGECSVSAG